MTCSAPATWAVRKQKDKLYTKTVGQEWLMGKHSHNNTLGLRDAKTDKQQADLAISHHQCLNLWSQAAAESRLKAAQQ